VQAIQSEVSLSINSILNDRYIIKQVMAISKLSFVYRAEHISTKEQLVIKEFFPHDIALRDLDNRTVINRLPSIKKQFDVLKEIFLNEAFIMQHLRHQNIIQYKHHFTENNSVYIITAYYEGILLDEYVNKYTIKDRHHLYKEIFFPLVHALAYLHDKGIIHRDIKPSNILVDAQGKPYLLDFGSATYFENISEYPIFTSAGYSPLEQYSDKAKQGIFTDIYSLAATLYYSLTNVRPIDVSQRLIEDKLVDVRNYNKKVSIMMAQMLMWSLQVPIKKRCPSLKFIKYALNFEYKVQCLKTCFKKVNDK